MRFAPIALALLFSPLLASLAFAQAPPPQLPPPQQGPPPNYYPPPQQQPPPGYYPPPQQQPPPGYYPPQQQPQYYPPPQQQPQYYPPPQQQPAPRAAPPPVQYEPPEPPTHAPKFSLWVGPRLTYQGFGFSFYRNDDNEHTAETTGNLIGNGVSTQIDVGARISHRYIPYIFYSHGFMLSGHRFDGASDASSSTDFYGVGFRFLSGDVDTVAFLSDISIGRRVITLKNGSEKYEMSGFEFFNLALGAEIRIMTLLTIEPTVSISGGSLNDTKGSVTFADGFSHPRYQNGAVIDDSRGYILLGAGIGGHFDVFGK
jgi:hypothetical protein